MVMAPSVARVGLGSTVAVTGEMESREEGKSVLAVTFAQKIPSSSVATHVCIIL